jgi:hypothetical protein
MQPIQAIQAMQPVHQLQPMQQGQSTQVGGAAGGFSFIGQAPTPAAASFGFMQPQVSAQPVQATSGSAFGFISQQSQTYSFMKNQK